MPASLVLAAGLTAWQPALADDQGKSAGDFLTRVRAIGVLPDERSTITVLGGSATASNRIVPEADFTYFATDNIAV